MKTKVPVVLLIAGALALIVAGIIGVIALTIVTTDISDEAIYTIDAPGYGTLEKGKYRLWVEIEIDAGYFERVWSEVTIEVFDPNNNSLCLVKSDGEDNYGDYRPYGNLTVPSDGEYRFETDTAREVYVTEPMDAGAQGDIIFLSFYYGIWAAVIGMLLIIIGIGLMIIGRGTDTQKGPN